MIRVKVCGMRHPWNVTEIAESKPDFMGFIFFRGSERYVGDDVSFSVVPPGIKRVGVFVNEEIKKIVELSAGAGFDMVQLHGNESPDACRELRSAGLTVIKAFNVGKEFNFDLPEKYLSVCDYFLFDAKSGIPGGSGMKFDWGRLEGYSLDKPFFLSGGIGPGDEDVIKSMENRALFAVDINSGFEISPGIKDAGKISKFIKTIKSDQL
jgi:phosphoribosylanthranilate isomerase